MDIKRFCVGYVRVSTEKQVEGYGLDSQKRDIIEYAKSHDMIISAWYMDEGITGMKMEVRNGLQNMISDINISGITDIIMYKLDRLSRDTVDALYMIEKIFKKKNVEVHSVHDYAKYETPQDKFQTHIMAAVAEYDRNTMLLRMRGGMLERVKNGYWPGGGNPPFCYSYDKNTGMLIPIPEKVKMANDAMDLFIQGYSDDKIYKMLGFRTEVVVRNILTSVTNIGMITYKGNVYKGRHEPVFDIEKFKLAQDIRNKRRVSKAYNLTQHMLTGLCVCGECGCKMRYQQWGNDTTFKIYCYSRNKSKSNLPNHNPNCTNKLYWADDIEKEVENAIKQIAIDLSSGKTVETKSKKEILNEKIKSEKTKLKRLYTLYADGNDSVLEVIREKEEEIKSLECDLEDENNNAEQELKNQKNIAEIKRIADIWGSIDNSSKNRLLKSIIDKIIIVNDEIEIRLKNFSPSNPSFLWRIAK